MFLTKDLSIYKDLKLNFWWHVWKTMLSYFSLDTLKAKVYFVHDSIGSWTVKVKIENIALEKRKWKAWNWRSTIYCCSDEVKVICHKAICKN